MDYLFLYPVRFLTLAALFVVLLGLPLRSRWMRNLLWSIAGLGMISYAITVVRDDMGDGVRAYDLEYFWNSGNLLREGKSPYEQPGTMNPPTAFPIYWLVSAVSFDEARIAWTLLVGLGAGTLVVLRGRILADGGDETASNLDGPIVALLTAVVCLSRSNRFGIELGQLALPVTLCLFWTLLARQKGKHTQAGIGLALASVKTPTLIPMLILFLRKREWKTWVVMSITGVALVLMMTAPSNILTRCRECLNNIASTREPGKIDDFEISNSRNNSMVAFNVLFNRFGVQDRTAVALMQQAALLVLGLWVAWLALRRMETPAAISVVCVFSMLFLYHRIYDLVLLVVPLTYAFGKARSEKGASRWLFVACAGCILLALNIREWLVADARARVLRVDDGVSTMLRIVVLPYLTWLVLSSLFLLILAERLRVRAATCAADEEAEGVAARGLPGRLSPTRSVPVAEGVG